MPKLGRKDRQLWIRGFQQRIPPKLVGYALVSCAACDTMALDNRHQDPSRAILPIAPLEGSGKPEHRTALRCSAE